MNRLDLISGFFWLAIAAFLIPKALELEVGVFSNPKPGFLLFWSSMCLAVLSIVLMGKSVIVKDRRTNFSDPWKDVKWSNAIITILLLFFYASFLTSIGFLLAMFLFLAPLYYLGKPNLLVSIAGAAVTTIAAYVVFHFALQVPFPKGLIAW